MKKKTKTGDAELRKHVVELLRGGNAHADFDTAIERLPARLRGAKVANIPYTLWSLLEHIRIAQWDILEFSRDAKHVSPDWPSGYWPKEEAPASAAEWEKSVKAVRRDSAAMQALVKNPATDLLAPIPHGKGQTILREALLVADHTAYHLGEFVLLRRALGPGQQNRRPRCGNAQ